MRSAIISTLVSAAAIGALALPRRQESAGTARVDLADSVGETKFLGSGFIYGWPDNGREADTSISENLVTEIKFGASRGGGAQLPAPSKGWAVGGFEGYAGRFDSALSNYRTTRKYGGDFILLPHDIWGADGGLGDGLHPGDNGNWTEMELFYDQLINDLKANDMLEGLVFDIWNEPELDIFWNRPWDQYLEYYVRAHKIVRSKLEGTLISGPSGAHSPALDNEKWNTWLKNVAANDAVPDIYSWHQIGGWEREPDRTIPELNQMLEQYGLPQRPIDINEYAAPDEQNPGNSVFYLAQLERHNLRGLRANWGGGFGLHDTMGYLVFNQNGTYQPTGEWHLYKYYADMVGQRLATTVSDDYLFDVFAVASSDRVKVLAGTRTVQSPYDIEISNMTHLGFPEEGSVQMQTFQFNWAGYSTDTGGPVDNGFTNQSYSDNTLKIHVNPPTNATAFAFEIVL